MTDILAKSINPLKKSVLKVKKVLRTRTMSTYAGAHSDAQTESLCSFDDMVPMAPPSSNLSLPEFVSNVYMKCLDAVHKSPCLLPSGTFKNDGVSLFV